MHQVSLRLVLEYGSVANQGKLSVFVRLSSRNNGMLRAWLAAR